MGARELNMNLMEKILQQMEGGDQVVCQRWRNHRSQYRPSGEPIDIDGGGYHARIIPKVVAKDFVSEHHYSGSYVASRVSVGLIRDDEHGDQELCGVAGFSVPMSQAVIPKWLKCENNQGIDLGRFVLLDDVPANGETWFLAQSFDLLREELPEVDSVMATSDPIVRYNSANEIVMPGHVGTIYQAHNGTYLGRTGKKTVVSGEDGNVITARTISKVRNQETGKDYAYRKLLNAGVDAKTDDETWREFAQRASLSMRRTRHPGNHVYAWALGDNRRDRKEIRHRIGSSVSGFPKEVEIA